MGYDKQRFTLNSYKKTIHFYSCMDCGNVYSVVQVHGGYSIDCPFCHKSNVEKCLK